MAAADASGSSGSSRARWRPSASATLDWSTPALAITKPRRCCMIIRFGRLRTTLADSDRTTSTILGSLPTFAARASAWADGTTSARSTVRPSALETIFCAITTTSRSCRGWSARSAAARISAGKIISGLHHRQTRSAQLQPGGHREWGDIP